MPAHLPSSFSVSFRAERCLCCHRCCVRDPATGTVSLRRPPDVCLRCRALCCAVCAQVLGKDVRKSVESIRPKFIFFTFIGSEVPVLQRARVSVQRPDVEKIFNGYSVRMDISGGNMGTFSKAEIAKELLRCGGAHAPTHYVFGPSDELEVNPSPQ